MRWGQRHLGGMLAFKKDAQVPERTNAYQICFCYRPTPMKTNIKNLVTCFIFKNKYRRTRLMLSQRVHQSFIINQGQFPFQLDGQRFHSWNLILLYLLAQTTSFQEIVDVASKWIFFFLFLCHFNRTVPKKCRGEHSASKLPHQTSICFISIEFLLYLLYKADKKTDIIVMFPQAIQYDAIALSGR